MAGDPYRTLGISPTASEQELRAAYRRLALRHHPDRNGGSLESARRFEDVQEAYAEVRRRRAQTVPPAAHDRGRAREVDARMAELEHELRQAQAARDRAARTAAATARDRAARAAARAAGAFASDRHASDEELGYVRTDDSFTKIVDDALSELSHWVSERRHD